MQPKLPENQNQIKTTKEPPVTTSQESSNVNNVPTSVIQHAEPVKSSNSETSKPNSSSIPDNKEPTVTALAEEASASEAVAPCLSSPNSVGTSIPSGSTHTTASELRLLRRPSTRGKVTILEGLFGACFAWALVLFLCNVKSIPFTSSGVLISFFFY